MKKLKLLFAFLIIAQAGFGQGMFAKAMAKVAKMVGTGNDQTTSTLTDITPILGIGSNLHSSDLGTMDQTLFKGWQTGGDIIAFTFTKKSSSGFYKLDGAVTCDGVPVEYVTSGTYAFISAGSTAPRKIELSTSSGQKANFTIAPYKKTLKLISVNGQKDNISIDPTKDVILELGTDVPEGTLMKVSLAMNQVGIKSMVDVCYTKSGKMITIPAAAFRNLSIIPGGKGLYNYKKSYLEISFESMENATEVSGTFPAVQYRAICYDGKFVTVTAEPVLNPGLTVSGTDLQMDYTSFKPNAFYSRPMSEIKKIGVTSFAIRGTTYKQTTSTSETATTITTTTTTLQFPKQPDAVWDALLEKLYPEFVAILQSEIAPVLPLETITNTPSYATVDAFAKDDQNTTVEFARAFRNSKVLSAFLPVSEGYGSNSVNQRIMNETGTDALVTLTLDLEISEGAGGLINMSPKLAMEISGKTNGLIGNTKYCTVNIKSTAGVPFSNTITPEQLEAIVRKSDLMTVFRKSIKEMVEKEKASPDYVTVWNMQK
jgi:hypothetical protein